MATEEKQVWANEERCRRIFKALLKKEFKSIRPNWLRYPLTGKNLELDGYNEELKVGFEYQGQQHYKFCKHVHATQEDFEAQQARDEWKAEKCKELGITLIAIPYTVKFYMLQKFIYTKLKEHGLR
jgi:hypothetical protein